jgi:hypothetical protein
VENRRLRAGHPIQRTGLYLGAIHDTQQAAWRKSRDALNEATQRTEPICLFPEDREIPPEVLHGLQVKLSQLTLQHPRVLGDGWRTCRLWAERHLGSFWRQRRPDGKAQVPWFKVLELLFPPPPQSGNFGQSLHFKHDAVHGRNARFENRRAFP